MNPYDPAAPPDSWMPRDLQIDPINRNAVSLHWQQDELHIDGYTLIRDVSGEISEFILPFDSLRFTDLTVIDSTATDTCAEVTYSVMARAGGNRSSAIDTDILIAPFVSDAIAGQNQTFSGHATETTLSANSPGVGETGQWSLVNGNGGSFTDASSPTSGFMGQMCTDYNLRWTITGACDNESSDEVSVSFQQQPTQSDAGQDIVTTDLTINLLANSPAAGESGQWSIVLGSGGAFIDASAHNSAFTGVVGQSYLLQWQIAGVCSSSTDEVSVTITPSIGDVYQGGIVFYLDGNGGGLIAAPTDQSTAPWGCSRIIMGGTQFTIGSGAANTAAIVNDCDEVGIAAKICNDLTIDGYTDWFLPSKAELELMSENLHTQGLGGFQSGDYWSSTEYNADDAWAMRMGGTAGIVFKGFTYRVRAVRAF